MTVNSGREVTEILRKKGDKILGGLSLDIPIVPPNTPTITQPYGLGMQTGLHPDPLQAVTPAGALVCTHTWPLPESKSWLSGKVRLPRRALCERGQRCYPPRSPP